MKVWERLFSYVVNRFLRDVMMWTRSEWNAAQSESVLHVRVSTLRRMIHFLRSLGAERFRTEKGPPHVRNLPVWLISKLLMPAVAGF